MTSAENRSAMCEWVSKLQQTILCYDLHESTFPFLVKNREKKTRKGKKPTAEKEHRKQKLIKIK